MLDYKTWYEALAEIHSDVVQANFDAAYVQIGTLINKLGGTIEEPNGFFKPDEDDSDLTVRAMLHEWVSDAGASGPSNILGQTVHRLNHAYHIAKHLAGDN